MLYRTAESLQIRGLAECATKQLETDQLQPNIPPPQSLIGQTPPILPTQPIHSTPAFKGDAARKRVGLGGSGSPIVGGSVGSSAGGGILAKHLAKMMDGSNLPPLPPAQFDFPEGLLPRHPNHLTPPPMKKSRKSEPRQSGSGNASNHLNTTPTPTPPPPPPCLKDLPPFLSMNREDRLMMMKNFTGGFSSPPKSVTPRTSNNNNYDHEEGPLKIDEDIDPGKENRIESPGSASNDDDIAEVASNGVSSDEEEEALPGPGGVELGDTPSKSIGLSGQLFGL